MRNRAIPDTTALTTAAPSHTSLTPSLPDTRTHTLQEVIRLPLPPSHYLSLTFSPGSDVDATYDYYEHRNPLSPNFSPPIMEPPSSTGLQTVASPATCTSASTATALARHDSRYITRLDFARKETEEEEQQEEQEEQEEQKEEEMATHAHEMLEFNRKCDCKFLKKCKLCN